MPNCQSTLIISAVLLASNSPNTKVMYFLHGRLHLKTKFRMLKHDLKQNNKMVALKAIFNTKVLLHYHNSATPHDPKAQLLDTHEGKREQMCPFFPIFMYCYDERAWFKFSAGDKWQALPTLLWSSRKLIKLIPHVIVFWICFFCPDVFF